MPETELPAGYQYGEPTAAFPGGVVMPNPIVEAPPAPAPSETASGLGSDPADDASFADVKSAPVAIPLPAPMSASQE